LQLPLDSLGKHGTVWVQTDLCALELSAHVPAEEQEKELHSWKVAERSGAPGWRIKGCFIPAKSQSSPNRHDSELGFSLDVSVLYP